MGLREFFERHVLGSDAPEYLERDLVVSGYLTDGQIRAIINGQDPNSVLSRHMTEPPSSTTASDTPEEPTE